MTSDYGPVLKVGREGEKILKLSSGAERAQAKNTTQSEACARADRTSLCAALRCTTINYNLLTLVINF